MNKVLIALVVAWLAGCAQGPAVSVLSAEKQYETFRSEVKEQRTRGEIGAAEAQQRLRDRYMKLFGRNREAVGHFAFAESLMRSAEAGDFPMDEAETLVSAREDSLFAMEKETRRTALGYEYPAD